MAQNPITRQHILDAVDLIEKENIPLKPSKAFDVVINNQLYPPVDIMKYANLIANGVKEWKHSGGEPTNKHLAKLDFEIISKENFEVYQVEESLIKVLKRVGIEHCRIFFDTVSYLVKHLDLTLDDPRLSLLTPGFKHLVFLAGQRYCLSYKVGAALPWSFISEVDMPETDDMVKGKFNGNSKAFFYRVKDPQEMISRLPSIKEATEN